MKFKICIFLLFLIANACKKDILEVNDLEPIVNPNNPCTTQDIFINIDSLVSLPSHLIRVDSINLCTCDTINFYNSDYNEDLFSLNYSSYYNNTLTQYLTDSFTITNNEAGRITLNLAIFSFNFPSPGTDITQNYDLIYKECP